MKVNDGVLATGEILLQLFDKNGRLKQEVRTPNIVTDLGRSHLANQLSLVAIASPISYIAIGSGSGQVVSDQELDNELGRGVISSVSQGTGDEAHKVIYVAEVEQNVGTGTITEAGLFNASTGGTMVCYKEFTAIEKTITDSLVITWKIAIN